MGEMVLNGRLYGANGIRELTQAQYDALPASKLTDGVLYCIKDSGIVEGDQYAPVIYSLEEREVGTWTDGKPLYQKTWILTVPDSTGLYSYTDVVVPNLEKVVRTAYSIGTASIEPVGEVGYAPWASGQATVLFSGQNATLVQFYFGGTYHSGGKLLYTSQYTKTTDVPGSGSWGMDGVPMVHYDGNEKIIGTWFGETLYEKTIDFGMLPNSDTKTISHGISNLKRIINIYGYAYRSSDQLEIPLPFIGKTTTNDISVFVSATNGIEVTTRSDRTAFLESYITLQYTKSS